MATSIRARVVALSVGRAASIAISILTMALMARWLDKESFAAYRQTFLAFAVVSPLLGMGMSTAMYYFLPGNSKRARGRVVDSIVLLAIMGLLYALAIALGGNNWLASAYDNPQVSQLLLWMIPYSIITTPAQQTEAVLVARDKTSTAAIWGVSKQIVIGITTILPMIAWRNAEAPLIGNVLASCFLAIASIVLMIRATPKQRTRPSIVSMREMVVFSIPLTLASIAGTLGMQTDKLIVSFYTNPEEFAVFAVGAMELPIIAIITGSLTAVLLVEMREACKGGSFERALQLFYKCGEKTSRAILPIMAFLLVNADVFIVALYSDSYRDSVLPFQIYLLMLPVRTVAFGSIIIAMGKNWFITFREVSELAINVALSIVLVQNFGAIGAAISTVALTIFYGTGLSLWFISRETGRSIWKILPWLQYIRILSFALLVTLTARLVSEYFFGTKQAIVELGLQSLVLGLWLAYELRDELRLRLPRVFGNSG